MKKLKADPYSTFPEKSMYRLPWPLPRCVSSLLYSFVVITCSFSSCTRDDTNIGTDDWYPQVEFDSETLRLDLKEVIWPTGKITQVSAMNDPAQLSIDYHLVELTSPREILSEYFVGFDHTLQIDGPVYINIDSLVGIPDGIHVHEFERFIALVDCSDDLNVSFIVDLASIVGTVTKEIEEGDSSLLTLTGIHPGGLILFIEPVQSPMTVRIYLAPMEVVDAEVYCTTPGYPVSTIYSQEQLTVDPFPRRLRNREGSFDSSVYPWEISAETDYDYDLVLIQSPDGDELTVAEIELVNCLTLVDQPLTFNSSTEGSFILPSYLDPEQSSLNGITIETPFRERLFEDLRRMRIEEGPEGRSPGLRIQWVNADADVPLVAQYYIDTEQYGEIDISPPFKMDIGVGVDTIPLTEDFLLVHESILGEGGSDLADQVRLCVRIADGQEVLTDGLEGELIIEHSLLPF